MAGPLSAVGAAAFPTVVGAALGERLPVLGLVGAIWLDERPDRLQKTGLVLGAVAVTAIVVA